MPNPEYWKAQKLRLTFYNSNIKRFIFLFKENDQFIFLPRGCLEKLINLLNIVGVKHTLIDRRNKGKKIDVLFKGELEKKQEDGLMKLLKYENGLFKAPPSFGKTVTAIKLISDLKVSTLVIVPTLTLLQQWKERLNSFLDVQYEYKKEKDKFGEYKGSKKKLTGFIDIACVDSLNNEDGYKLLKNYGLVILDEVHHFGATTYEQVIRKCESKYIYGFTATPERSDHNENIVFKTIGEIRFSYDGEINNEIRKLLYVEFYGFKYKPEDEKLGYSEKLNILCRDEKRNLFILEILKKKFEENKHILLLSDRVEQIEFFYEKLKENKNIFILHGNLKTTEKKEIMESIKNNKDPFILLSTGKFVGEGFDLKELDTLFVASPFKWKGTLEQYVGRLERKNDGKTEIEVHDFVDFKIGIFSHMYNARMNQYKNLGYSTQKKNYFSKSFYNEFEYKNVLIDDIKKAKDIFINASDFEKSVYNYLIGLNTSAKIESNIINLDGELLIKNSLLDKGINLIIIDSNIVYYGDLNPFIYKNYKKNLIRIEDGYIASQILKETKEFN